MAKRGRKPGYKWSEEQRVKFMATRARKGHSEPNTGIVAAAKEATEKVGEGV